MLDKNRHKRFIQAVGITLGVFALPLVVGLVSWWWWLPVITVCCNYLNWVYDGVNFMDEDGDPGLLMILWCSLFVISAFQPIFRIDLRTPPLLWTWAIDFYKLIFEYITG